MIDQKDLRQEVAEHLMSLLVKEKTTYQRQVERLTGRPDTVRQKDFRMTNEFVAAYSTEVVRQLESVLDRWDMMTDPNR